MSHPDVERRLAQALEHAAPQDLDGVLSRCEKRKGTVITMTKKKKSAALGALAACLALLLIGGGAAGYQYSQYNAVASVVSLDVNPSIQLEVNKNEKVLSATPMNADAEIILEGMDLTGAQATVALNAIIGSLLQHGYVDELANSILITVEDDDAQRGARLQQELTAQADAALATAQVNGAILSQTLQHSDFLSQQAAEYGISAGKAALIQAIVDGSAGTKTFADLVGLSINELNLIYTSQTTQVSAGTQQESAVIGGADGPTGIQVTTGAIQTSGAASQSAYIGVEAAQAAALRHAGVDAADAVFLEYDFDWEDGRMVYELDFRTSTQKYEYDIDATTGGVVKFESERFASSLPSAGAAGAADYIGEDAAKTAALNHAGVKESETAYCNVWLEYDDGRAEHYQVEFAAGSTKYEYEIALTSATVLKQEQEPYRTSTGGAGSSGSSGGASGADIGEDAALAAALEHAGVSQSDVTVSKLERDRDDGRVEYEVEFWYGQVEYEYTIDAATGAIRDFDMDDHGSAGASSGDIGWEKARDVALSHAGYAQSDVWGLEVDQDWDDGRLEYEVEFEVGGRDYEYTIDGSSGTILSYDHD